MGNSCGVSSRMRRVHAVDPNVKWKRKLNKEEALQVYVEEGTLPENCSVGLLELRAFLDEPVLFRGLVEYAIKMDLLSDLTCWIEVLEYKHISEKAIDCQMGKGLHIYNKYFKSTTDSLYQKYIKAGDEIVSTLQSTLTEAHQSGAALSSHLYDEVLQRCLQHIYTTIYVPYKKTAEFMHYAKQAHQSYNKMSVDDFEYFEELGQGGFGLVVHCKKKSTGKHYAMKIQTKFGLLDCFCDNPARVMLEREAASHCHHNFIVSMDYAFQTESLAFMVVDLGTCGTLADALSRCDNRAMSEERVVFYSAEIILALSHIHRLGLIYRDLKPGNVLLCEDGHIKLVDLGSVVDVGGKVFGSSENDCSVLEGMHRSKEETFRVSTCGLHAGSMVGNQRSGSGQSALEELSAIVSPKLQTDAEPSVTRSKGAFPFSTCATTAVTSATARRNSDSLRKEALGPGSLLSPGPSYSPVLPTSPSGNNGGRRAKTLPRATSVMGTRGYMAPEMMIISQDTENHGYTAAVDYWSLGVMMYKLLTSKLPFHNGIVASFMDYANKVSTTCDAEGISSASASTTTSDISETASVNTPLRKYPSAPSSLKIDLHMYAPKVTKHPALLAAFVKLDANKHVTTACKAAIAHFLEVDEQRRLGSGPGGLRDIKAQPLYKGVNWAKLTQRLVSPPFIPRRSDAPDVAPTTFEDMMESFGKARWMFHTIPNEDKQYFENWDWVSPSTLKSEVGIEEQIEYGDIFQMRFSIDLPSYSNSVSRKVLGSGGNGSISAAETSTHSPNQSLSRSCSISEPRKRPLAHQSKEAISELQRQLSCSLENASPPKFEIGSPSDN